MTKKDLTIRIALETEIRRDDVASVVQKTFDGIADGLVEGRGVELRNFGVFKLKLHKGSGVRRLQEEREELFIPDRRFFKFVPGKKLDERLLKLPVSKLGG